MNSDIELVCYAPDAARRLSRAERWLRAFEERFSRFRPLSELSRLNASSGRPFRASPQFFSLLEVGLQLAERSGGLFDPTILRQLEAAGYDRSFESIGGVTDVSFDASSDPLSLWERARPALSIAEGMKGYRASWRDLRLDRERRSVLLPAGAGLDLGGIGKGRAVDRLASILGSPSLVNGGGDIFASGCPHDAQAWLVGVEDPFSPHRDLTVLAVHDRGVATSSRLRRRWQQGDRLMHHLIDPRTGRPSTSVVVQATVIAPTTLLADYHAKVALLLGAKQGLTYLNREVDVEGLLVLEDGAVLRSDDLARYEFGT
jgi:thiamine biosynthesis lipoprotein